MRQVYKYCMKNWSKFPVRSDLWYPDPQPSADFWWQELDSMNAALQERLKTAELLRTEALAQVRYHSVLSSFLANISKACHAHWGHSWNL